MNEEQMKYVANLISQDLEKDKEIERLNNIINELEKALKSHQYIKVNAHYGEYYVEIDEVLNFIKKLKEGK